MADTSTIVFTRPAVREGDKISPILSFPPSTDHFSLRTPLNCSLLSPPDNKAFLSPCVAASVKQTNDRKGQTAREIFSQVFSKKNMLSHASSLAEVEVEVATGQTDASTGLGNTDSGELLIDELEIGQDVNKEDENKTAIESKPSANSGGDFFDAFLDMGVASDGNNNNHDNNKSDSAASQSSSQDVSSFGMFSSTGNEDTSMATTENISTSNENAEMNFGFGSDVFFSGDAFDTTSNMASKEVSNNTPINVDVALHCLEELLSITRNGKLERFEVSGTAKVSVLSLEDSSNEYILKHEDEVVLDIDIKDSQEKLKDIVPIPPTESFHCTVSRPSAQVSLTTLPTQLHPIFKYRAIETYRPELFRANSSITRANDGKSLAVSIQVMLNTKFHTTLENISVMISFAPFVEGYDGDVTNVRSRPSSGTYNSVKRVLSWECGSHVPSSMPMLKMDALLIPPPALSSETARLPKSVPIIVKAFTSAPLIPDCSLNVGKVETRPKQGSKELSTKSFFAVNNSTISYKSKCEYRML